MRSASNMPSAYPSAATHMMPMYPPMVYQPYPHQQPLQQPTPQAMPQFQQPMSNDAHHHMLLLTATPLQVLETCYDADDESESQDCADECHSNFTIVMWGKFQRLLSDLRDADDEFDTDAPCPPSSDSEDPPELVPRCPSIYSTDSESEAAGPSLPYESQHSDDGGPPGLVPLSTSSSPTESENDVSGQSPFFDSGSDDVDNGDNDDGSDTASDLPCLVSCSSSSSADSSDTSNSSSATDDEDSGDDTDLPCMVSVTSSSDDDYSDDDSPRSSVKNDSYAHVYNFPDSYEQLRSYVDHTFQAEMEKELATLRLDYDLHFHEIPASDPVARDRSSWSQSTLREQPPLAWDLHEARRAPGRYFTHTQRGNPFDVDIITLELLDALILSYADFDCHGAHDSFQLPFSSAICGYALSETSTILIVAPGAKPDADPPPPPPPSRSPSPSVSTDDAISEEPMQVASQRPETDFELPQVESFDNARDMLSDDVLRTLDTDVSPASIEKPQDPPSDGSVTLPYNPAPPPVIHRRKFKGHKWSAKGTKASRRKARARSTHARAPAAASYSLPVPSVSSSDTEVEATSTPTKRSRIQCEHPECTRFPAKRKYAPGYFRYCFHHRHLNSPAPESSASKPAVVSVSHTPVSSVPTARILDVTDHATSSQLSAELREQALNIESSLPRL